MQGSKSMCDYNHYISNEYNRTKTYCTSKPFIMEPVFTRKGDLSEPVGVLFHSTMFLPVMKK